MANFEINLSKTAVNSDWIRSARLLEEGSKESLKKLKKLNETEMLTLEELKKKWKAEEKQ